MTNTEEITTNSRLSGCSDQVVRGNLRRFTFKLQKFGGSRLLIKWPETWKWDGCKTFSFVLISNGVLTNVPANHNQSPGPQSETSARIMLFSNQVGTVCNSFPNPQSHSGVFSPVIRLHQETQLDGGRKFWEAKKKKNSGGSRKFNQIGTNGICFSVSPAPSVPKQARKPEGKWGQKKKISLADLTLQNRSSLHVPREHHNYNSIFSITCSPWEKLQTFPI